jgi:hypothetical protein
VLVGGPLHRPAGLLDLLLTGLLLAVLPTALPAALSSTLPTALPAALTAALPTALAATLTATLSPALPTTLPSALSAALPSALAPALAPALSAALAPAIHVAREAFGFVRDPILPTGQLLAIVLREAGDPVAFAAEFLQGLFHAFDGLALLVLAGTAEAADQVFFGLSLVGDGPLKGLLARLRSALLTALSATLTSALTPALTPALATALATALAFALTTTLPAALATALATALSSALPTALTTALSAALAAALTAALAFALTAALAAALPTTLTAALAAALAFALCGTLSTALAAALAFALTAALAAALATALAFALTTTLAAALASALAFALAGTLAADGAGEAVSRLADDLLVGGDAAESLEPLARRLPGAVGQRLLLADESLQFAHLGFEAPEDVLAAGDLVGLAFLGLLLLDEVADLVAPGLQFADAFFEFARVVGIAGQDLDQFKEGRDDLLLRLSGRVQFALVEEGDDLGHVPLDEGVVGLAEGLHEAGGLLGLGRLEEVGEAAELVFEFLHHLADAVLPDAEGGRARLALSGRRLGGARRTPHQRARQGAPRQHGQ